MIDITAGRRDNLVVVADSQRRYPLSFLDLFDAFSQFLREYQIVRVEVDGLVVLMVSENKVAAFDEPRVKRAILQDYLQAVINVAAQAHLQRNRAGKLKAFVCDVPPAKNFRNGD